MFENAQNINVILIFYADTDVRVIKWAGEGREEDDVFVFC